MSLKKSTKKKNKTKPLSLLNQKEILKQMNKCSNVEDLNNLVITPFTKALVDICGSRGYVVNIYGNNCNLVISPENHSEDIYKIIDSYLDNLNISKY